MNPKPPTIEEYFSARPKLNQEKPSNQIRQVILNVESESQEVISYHILHLKTSEVLV